MRVSREWLQEFVDIPKSVSAEQLSHDVTMKVVEVDELIDMSAQLNDVVVGEVQSIEKHPNADKLQVCHVVAGKEKAQIVCGGSNLREGMKVAFGKVGAKVRWHGEGDLITLEKVKIRGVESSGMICAADEIGLGEQFPKKDEKEILDLSHVESKPGTALATALGMDGVVLEIENKSMNHRPDLWGQYGIARELAALYGKPLKPLNLPAIKESKDATLSVDVKVKDLCRAYSGVIVDGVSIAPSPDWMQQRLLAVGIRPINNIVDVTNYVMLEIGQPTHAFDVTKMASTDVIVRKAKNGEAFTTLDDKTHELTDEMFVIADKEKAIALGGLMGGANTQVTNETTAVLFESANFDPTVVRKTSRALGFRTDGSARWEKDQDPTNSMLGLQRLVALTLELCSEARVASNVVNEQYMTLSQGSIELDVAFAQRKIGVDISPKEIISILENLGFGVNEKNGVLSVTVPTWRATKDVSIPEDLIEEIARMYGYGNIAPTMPKFSIAPPPKNALRDALWTSRETLANECGFTEVYNYSFVSPEWLARIGLDTKKHIELNKPLAKDRPYVRRSLEPGLLENVERNLHRFDSVRAFEVGRVYHKEGKGLYETTENKERLPQQDTIAALVVSEKGNEQPFFDVSHAVQRLAKHLGASFTLRKHKPKETHYHPGRYAEVCIGKEVVGRVGELHPMTQEVLGIPYHVAIASLNLSTLVPLLEESSSYMPLSQYPEVQLDVACIVDREVEHAAVVEALTKADPLLVSVELFDVYAGNKMEKGKKSMAYRCTYRRDDRTLEAKEVDEVHACVIKLLEKKFDAEIRK